VQRPAGQPALRAAAAGRAGSGPRLEAAVQRPAGQPALRAAAAGRAGSGPREAAARRPAGQPALRVAAVGRAESGRPREAAAARRPAGQPALRAEAVGRAESGQSPEVPHEAVHREGSAPAWVAREVSDRAAFAPRRAAAHPDAAVVAERAARWRVLVGREARWRRADVAGQAHLEPAHLAPAHLGPGAGRVAACRPPGAERLVQGACRRLWTAKESFVGSRRQKVLQYKVEANYVSFDSSPCG
jgi:hypothetical protein